jgi:hypothetical protein
MDFQKLVSVNTVSAKAHGLGGQGYHWLLAIPHNEPDEKFARD